MTENTKKSTTKHKTKFFFSQTIFLVMLIAIYSIIIEPRYSYVGYFDSDFSLIRSFIALALYMFAFICFKFVHGDFYRTTFQGVMFFSVVPTVAYIIFNNVSVNVLLIQIIPLIALTIVSKYSKEDFKTKRKVKLDNTTFAIIAIALALLSLPFYLRLGDIKLSNLLLEDVYDARNHFKETSNVYVNYLTAPLSKIIYPILAIYSIDRKRYLFSFISILNILVLYLTTGAQKDILVGLLMIIVCYVIASKKGMEASIKKIIVWMSRFMIIEILLYASTGITILSTYIRRVFFVMPGLLSGYYDYFTEHGFTYFSQTRLGSLGSDRLILTTWAGENIFGQNINANIGIFAEGYVSFGLLGVLMMAIIFTIVCLYINTLNIEAKYIGLWVAILYLINFSLVETLFITHGLILFLLIARFFIPTKKITV